MKILPLMLTLVCCSAASAQGVPRPFIPPPPGPLETFLANNPNATVVRKQTGILVGSNRDTAVFFAIVASSPADSTVKFKGMEIRITDAGRTSAMYFDYEPAVRNESRDNFQLLLDRLADATTEGGHISLVREQVAGATRWGVSAEGSFRNQAILNIGYWHGETDTGVTIWDAHRDHSTYLPGSTVEQAMACVKAAREFIITN